MFEGKKSAEKGKQNDAARPSVNESSLVLFTSNHFRGGIAGASTRCLKSLSDAESVREAEVNYFDVFIVIQKQVFGLEVSVDNAESVHVLDARYYLLVELASFDFFQARVFNDVVEELSAARVLHDQVKELGGFDYFVELNDVGVANQLQNMHFP